VTVDEQTVDEQRVPQTRRDVLELVRAIRDAKVEAALRALRRVRKKRKRSKS